MNSIMTTAPSGPCYVTVSFDLYHVLSNEVWPHRVNKASMDMIYALCAFCFVFVLIFFFFFLKPKCQFIFRDAEAVAKVTSTSSAM